MAPTPKLMLANADDVTLQILESHGPTAQFKLLMGTTASTRDKLSAASQMVSLFIMDFAPGGTNIPHHHDMEEEIYYILRGHGDMVAGGGADGNEGRYPAQAGRRVLHPPECHGWILQRFAERGPRSGSGRALALPIPAKKGISVCNST